MAEVRGRPYLEYLFDQVLAAGARHAVLCTGYKADQIEAAFGLAYRGLRLSYSEEPSPLGTGGAMRYALPHIESETVLAMNGDSYCAADLTTFQKWHHEHGAAASLLLAQVSDTSRFGRVQTDDEGRVLKFGEKGEHSGPGWINAGIYLIQRELLEAIPEGKISIEREVFPSQIGHGLYASQTGGRFLDIGTPESYAEAEEFFKDPNVKTGYGNHLMPKDFRSPPDYLVEDAGSISQTLSSEEG
jgi:NDP-sugar pyrophosphorylase family protein